MGHGQSTALLNDESKILKAHHDPRKKRYSKHSEKKTYDKRNGNTTDDVTLHILERSDDMDNNDILKCLSDINTNISELKVYMHANMATKADLKENITELKAGYQKSVDDIKEKLNKFEGKLESRDEKTVKHLQFYLTILAPTLCAAIGIIVTLILQLINHNL